MMIAISFGAYLARCLLAMMIAKAAVGTAALLPPQPPQLREIKHGRAR